MECSMPADDDVVVEAYGPVQARRHSVRVTSGPPQLTCRSLAEATHIAGAFAAHARVDVWVRQATGTPSMVASFRDPATGNRRPSADDAVVVSASAVASRRVRRPDS